MEITWHNDTCFLIKGKTKSLVINPDRKAGKLKGEIVLSSLKPEAIEAVEGAEKVCDWPGEYEIKNVSIDAFTAWTRSRSKEEEVKKSEKADRTLIFCFEFGGIKFCHLGELGHSLTSDMIAEIGDVDILMIKVGEDSNLGVSKAMEIIEAIEPRAVIPMGTDSPGEVLKSLAGDKVEAFDKFVIKSVSELPEEQMKYIVLNRVAA